MKLPAALLLMGPTAGGKTALACELVRRFPVDIVSVDSAQVFRDMDIGTAKPDAETLAAFPHRLIDIVSPEQRYSAARFRDDALAEMAAILAAGRIPLLVGGTMLYFKALREGLADLPAADSELRAAIDRDAVVRGWPALHAELALLDPATAARLAPNDAQRIQRALEIVRATGRPMAEFHADQTPQPLPYRTLAIALVPSDRQMLHARIAARFDDMLDQGLVGEVEGLRAKYRLDASLPSMRCVGYRQVWDMLAGNLPAGELRDRGIFATRQLAKRQLTWLRSMSGLEAFDPLDAATRGRVVGRVDRHLSGRD